MIACHIDWSVHFKGQKLHLRQCVSISFCFEQWSIYNNYCYWKHDSCGLTEGNGYVGNDFFLLVCHFIRDLSKQQKKKKGRKKTIRELLALAVKNAPRWDQNQCRALPHHLSVAACHICTRLWKQWAQFTRKCPHSHFLFGALPGRGGLIASCINPVYFILSPSFSLISSSVSHCLSLPLFLTPLYPSVSVSRSSPNFLSISFLCVNSLKSIMHHTDSLISWIK